MKRLTFLWLLPIIGATQVAFCQKDSGNLENKQQMESTASKIVIQKLYDEALNKRNTELLKDLISEDYQGPLGVKGPAGFEQNVETLLKSFPDIQWKIYDLMADGSKVFVRWAWKGTHTSIFGDIGPTGKVVTNEGMAVFEMRGGKVVGSNVQTDRLGFLQQLEVLPLNVLSQKSVDKGGVHFIDKFIVPAGSKIMFLERMQINRAFIKNLPGFIQDAAYSRSDEEGNLICVTIAIWKDQQALDNAKESVQAEFKRTGFNPTEFYKRLNIKLDRGIYQRLEE